MLPHTRPSDSPPIRLCRIPSLVLSLLLLLTGTTAYAESHTTAFLPFNVHAADQAAITRQADDALAKKLAGASDFLLIPRQRAEQLVDYSAAWPPPAATLSAIAETTGQDYVALGTITVIGDTLSLDYTVFDSLTPQTPFTSYKEGVRLEDLDATLDAVVADIRTYTNRGSLIASIEPEGNKRIDSGAILQKIHTKPGDVYDPSALRQDLKAVFAMGSFEEARIKANDTKQGKQIIFQVKEKPVISKIVITGADEITEKDVREAADLKEKSILNTSVLKNGVQRVKELYKDKGFHNTTVTSELKPVGEDRVEVILTINEGKKIYINKIAFTGNNTFDADTLEDAIETKTRGWFAWFTDSGILKKEVLQQDTARLTAFYNNHGFLEAHVSDPEVVQENDALTIIFHIQEGTRYRVGTVSLGGDLIADKEKLLGMLKIRDEEYLNKQVVRADTMRLTDYYAEQGYAFADVHPSVQKSAVGKRVDIHLDLDKGPLVYFNRVEIIGNTRTRDNVIRRELTIKEGGVFDSKAIKESIQNLQRLGFFDDVNIRPHPGLSDDLMDVTVEVKERSTGQFSIGAGYSSSDYLMFMAEVAENNLLGTGNRLSLNANISGTSSRYNLSFTNPRILDSNVTAGIDVFDWEREYDDYTKESKGGALRFGHPFTEKWRIYYSYAYTDTTLSDVADTASYIIKQSENINIESAVNVSLARDSRNRFFAPSEGSLHKVSVEYAGGPIGGDAEFTKVEGSTSWYFPLPLDTVFHAKAAAGQAFENETDHLPVYERFYLGGLNSIRGFKSARVSPRDPATGDRIGGDKMWYANLEIIFPLLKDAGLRGVVFTDFGNVYNDNEDWDFSTIKKTAGLGIRWLSPMGPLRLEWGYNLDPEPDDDNSVWDFSIGSNF